MRHAKQSRGAMFRGLFAVAFVGGGCGVNNPTYFQADGPLLVGGVGEDGMPRAGSATGVVTLGFRTPTAGEQTKLDAETTRLGFQAPWLRRNDIHIEVLYTITNVAAEEGTAQVLVNGANEITNYDLEVVRGALQMGLPADEEAIVLPLIQGIPVIMQPGQVRQGVVREDDFVEAALDLDAMGRWMAPFAAVLINRSQINPVGLAGVPPALIVPAIFRVAVTFNADVEMKLEYLVRVRDDADRLAAGSDPRFQPMPADFAPMVTYP